LPAQIVFGLINFFPNKPIQITSKDLIVNIACENHKSSFKSLNSEDFPIIPSVAEGESIKITGSQFCEGLSRVASIASPSTTKPEISGIYFSFQKNAIKMVATDSFRLGEKTVFLKDGRKEDSSQAFILPQRAAREIINIFGEEEEVRICFSPNQVLFESRLSEADTSSVQLISRLIEGEFPNYDAIVPKKYGTQVILSSKDFLSQIKSASVLSGKASEVRLTINSAKGQIKVSSQNQDLGEYQSEIPAKIKGESLEIAFNYKFLVEGILSSLPNREKNEEIVIELNGEEGAVVLKPLGDQGYIYILMPIKKS